MKVLWITNTIFPDLAIKLNIKPPVVGGWMYGLAEKVAQSVDSFSVATVHSTFECSEHLNGVDYFVLKGIKTSGKYDRNLEKKWVKLIEKIKPDVVHIHGTEYAHGLALIKAAPNLKYVISIQGLISVFKRYYLGRITHVEVKRNITLRDLLKNDNMIQARRKFDKRGLLEIEYIRSVDHVIGRTSWDKAHAFAINPDIQYHFCNESLRNQFYESAKWNIDKKSDFTIFLSQASYPLKGMHKVLEAVALLKNEFRSINIRVGGPNILREDSFKDRLKQGGYAKYLKRLIKKNQLGEHVTFLGSLSAENMIVEYLNCHVFICPSSIENSPNSLGEAQLLGVPSIASYVGGIPDMVEDGKTGLLYRFEEVEMLAQHLKRVFSDRELAQKLSENGIIAASNRHDRAVNLKNTIGIYKTLAS